MRSHLRSFAVPSFAVPSVAVPCFAALGALYLVACGPSIDPAAKADIEAHGALPVPAHLRNASSGTGKALGWGAGYRYPHDFEGHHVREEYLPEALRGRRYYAPSDSGEERAIAGRLAQWREKK